MIKWIPCELHTHTVNSDGSLTLRELAKKAKELGLECIALTDHNTTSGQLQIPSVTKETGMPIVHGMEWTTFYGHMVAMGTKEYVDWRNRGPLDIHAGIADIHEAGGLAGVAHPYRMGSPMCTGCYWQFTISDWKDIDYLEVWSETFPSVNPVNHRAFELWTGLLNEGHRLTAVSGRDWHGNGSGSEPIAVTYLGIDTKDENDIDRAVINALSQGRAVSTMGPLMLLTAELESDYGVGEEVMLVGEGNEAEFRVQFDFSTRKGMWEIDPKPMKVVLMSNKGRQQEIQVTTESERIHCTLQVQELDWVRAELYGSICGAEAMIAFTNPVYFKR